MYNGIGILTTRGTGTSGHVQSNRFNLRGPPPQRNDAPGDGAGPKQRRPNQDILEHNRKREIELQVEVLRAQLEDDEIPDEEIEEKLAAYRQELTAKAAAEAERAAADQAAHGNRDGKRAQETHEVAQRKLDQMNKLKNAFGFAEDINEGDAFNRELQEQKKQQKIAEREAREQERKDRIRKAEKAAKKAEKKRKEEEKKRKRDEEKAAKKAEKERKRESKRWSTGDVYYTKDAENVPSRYDPTAAPLEEDAEKKPIVEDGVPVVEPQEEKDVAANADDDTLQKRERSPSASPPRHASKRTARSRSPSRSPARKKRSPSPSRSPPRRRRDSRSPPRRRGRNDDSRSPPRGRGRRRSPSPKRRRQRSPSSSRSDGSSSSGTSSSGSESR